MQGIVSCWNHDRPACSKHTISERRARAGRSIGGASRCRSMASNTSTNLHLGSRIGYLSILVSSTVSWATDSHLRGASSHFKASTTAPMMRSKRCRPVMHCVELARAYWKPPAEASAPTCSESWARRRSRMLDFPVASVPWTTTFRQGKALG